jgi:hypothetical protein
LAAHLSQRNALEKTRSQSSCDLYSELKKYPVLCVYFMQIEIVMLIYLVSGIVPDYLRGLSDLHAPPSTMGSSEFPYSLDGK